MVLCETFEVRIQVKNNTLLLLVGYEISLMIIMYVDFYCYCHELCYGLKTLVFRLCCHLPVKKKDGILRLTNLNKKEA